MDDAFETLEIVKKGKSDLNEFREQLPEKECRIATILYKWTLENGAERSKIINIGWCPLKAKVKERMFYSGALGVILKTTECEFMMQSDDLEGLSDASIHEKCMRNVKF
jgi:hypothetical protein